MFAQQELSKVDVDSTIRYGKLGNGVSYYIKPIDDYKGPVKMYFYVKVGQAFQEPEEFDFAHALEHLAFRETTNFPDGLTSNPEILAEVGLYDRSFYGTTAGNFTRYDFSVPNANNAARNLGLNWFRDIATELIISAESVDRERGVLLQEMAPDEINKGNRRAKLLLESRLFSCMGYAENFVQHNKTFSHLDLQNFYRKWYRPDRMVLLILGNINDIQELEKDIMGKFSDIPSAKENLEVLQCKELHYKKAPQFSVIQYDVEENLEESEEVIQFNLFYRNPLISKDLRSGNGIRKIILDDLISTVISNRLGSLSERYNPFFEASSLSTNRNGFLPNAIRVFIEAEKTREREAIKEVIYLVHQTATFGINDAEFVQAKQNYLNTRPLFLGEGISYWKDEIEHLITREESLPDGKAKSLRTWFENLTLQEFNKELEGVIAGIPEDIGALIPETYKTKLDSEEEIRILIRDILENPVEPFILETLPSQLIKPKKIKSLEPEGYTKVETDYPFRAQKFILRNGVSVILQPDNSMGQEIYLHGFRRYGASCLPKEDFFSALFSPNIIKYSGVGDFNRFELGKFLNSTSSLKTGVFPYIQYNETGIKGTTNSEELEDLLQLVYLFFTEPRKDSIAFESWRKETSQYANNQANLNHFIDLQNSFTKNISEPPRAIKLDEALKDVDFDKVFEIYKRAYGRAEDFTFILTGNFEVQSILPQIEKYLGNLPSSIEKKECRTKNQDELKLKNGPKFKKLKSPKGDVHGYYSLSYIKPKQINEDWKYELKFEVLTAVTQQLIKKLRAEGFSLYYFGVGGDLDRTMKRYEIHSNFVLLPDEWAQIRKRSLEKIEDILAGNISEGEFDNAIKTVLESYSENRLSHPIKVKDAIYRYKRYDETFINPSEVEEYINTLTVGEIVKIAQEIFQDKFLYEFVQK
ncbi:M16 family metallopeptidase [Salinimicrobium oceani]|uniref:Insulinase family protein n=1 Tax=Salinimicrobium oceani TaxID=2722702 RepID=A0ABX1CWQ2_9FLAO|nr:insulinase family protein [Salinimicrobium oceani]NJW52699.1 insulinase family protein [Salinimicrobium oceani]